MSNKKSKKKLKLMMMNKEIQPILTIKITTQKFKVMMMKTKNQSLKKMVITKAKLVKQKTKIVTTIKMEK